MAEPSGILAPEFGEVSAKRRRPDSNRGMVDLQSTALIAQVEDSKGLTESSHDDLARCLALLAQKWPDLAPVMTAWPDLPEALRKGIVAMVRASGNG